MKVATCALRIRSSCPYLHVRFHSTHAQHQTENITNENLPEVSEVDRNKVSILTEIDDSPGSLQNVSYRVDRRVESFALFLLSIPCTIRSSYLSSFCHSYSMTISSYAFFMYRCFATFGKTMYLSPTSNPDLHQRKENFRCFWTSMVLWGNTTPTDC